jgi:predicted RNA-binding protein YlqC (UPF0109 family)
MQELLLFLTSKLCEYKEDVRVFEEKEDDSAEFVLKVNQNDLKSIIGKHGRTIRAIRTLLAIASAKQGVRISLRVDVIPTLLSSAVLNQGDGPKKTP